MTLGIAVALRVRRKRKTTAVTRSDADDERPLDVFDGGANRPGAVERDFGLDRGRDGRRERREQRLDAVDGLDDVRAGLSSDDDDDRARTVCPTGDAPVLDVVEDVGDVPESDGRSVVVREHERLVGLGGRQLVVGAYGARDHVADQDPLRLVGRRRSQSLADVLHAEADAAEGDRVELDTDRGLLPAADGHLSDPRDLRDLLREDRVRLVVDHAKRQSVGDGRQDQDRAVCGVRLPERRTGRKVGWELAPCGDDGRLDVASCRVDVTAEVELERDRGGAQRARGGDLGDPGDAPEAPLERSRHRRGHRLRARAGERCRHVDGREVDLGQRRDGEESVYAAIPASRMAAASSDVAIGRLMKGAEMFTARLRPRLAAARRAAVTLARRRARPLACPR